jgi:hypothetical protein
MSATPEYHQQDKARDPTQVRTIWILGLLRKRPHTGDEIRRLSESNGLGYRPATYVKDMTGLVARNLVYRDTQGGVYKIHEVYGSQYCLAHGI